MCFKVYEVECQETILLHIALVWEIKRFYRGIPSKDRVLVKRDPGARLNYECQLLVWDTHRASRLVEATWDSNETHRRSLTFQNPLQVVCRGSWTGGCGSGSPLRFKAYFPYLWREGSVWGNLEGRAQRRSKIQGQRGSGKSLDQWTAGWRVQQLWSFLERKTPDGKFHGAQPQWVTNDLWPSKAASLPGPFSVPSGTSWETSGIRTGVRIWPPRSLIQMIGLSTICTYTGA